MTRDVTWNDTDRVRMEHERVEVDRWVFYQVTVGEEDSQVVVTVAEEEQGREGQIGYVDLYAKVRARTQLSDAMLLSHAVCGKKARKKLARSAGNPLAAAAAGGDASWLSKRPA